MSVGVLCAVSPTARWFSAADVALLERCAESAAAWFANNREAVILSCRRQVDTEVERLLIGDRWRVTGRAGAGGQSDVWLARELVSGRDVAVKIATTSGSPVIKEARAFSTLRHTSLINVHAAGMLPDGREYAVMEYVDGEPFAEHVTADGSVDLDLLLDRLGSIAGALTALHAAGWVHGDVKCANILVDRARDRAVLIDLGLGITLGEPMSRRGGTLGVSAPEQFDQSRPPINRSADVYGLAMTFIQVVTGQNPFRAVDLDCGIVEAQRRGLPPDAFLTDPRFAMLEPVLRWALHPDPKERQRSPLTLLLELRQAARGFPNGRPPPHGIAMEVLRAVFHALPPKLQESPAMERFRTIRDKGWTYVTMDAWSDFLATCSGGQPDTVCDIVKRSVRARGRQGIRASHLSFDPQPVVEFMLEHFDYYLPVYQLELFVTDGTADGFVDLDADHVPLLQAHFETFFREMIAFTGARGETTWSPRTRHRWAVTFRWHRS